VVNQLSRIEYLVFFFVAEGGPLSLVLYLRVRAELAHNTPILLGTFLAIIGNSRDCQKDFQVTKSASFFAASLTTKKVSKPQFR